MAAVVPTSAREEEVAPAAEASVVPTSAQEEEVAPAAAEVVGALTAAQEEEEGTREGVATLIAKDPPEIGSRGKGGHNQS